MTWERRSSFRLLQLPPLFSFYSYVLSRVICMGYDGSVAFGTFFGLRYSSIVFRHLWNTPPYNPLFLCLIGLVFVGWIRHFAQVKMISPNFLFFFLLPGFSWILTIFLTRFAACCMFLTMALSCGCCSCTHSRHCSSFLVPSFLGHVCLPSHC